MKKLLLIALVIASMFVLSACSPTFAQSVVELPSPLQLAILTGVTFVVGFIFAKIAEAVPALKDFLGQYVDEVATAVAGGLVLTIQNFLNAIPPEWEGVANAFLAFLVAVLAAIGLLRTTRKAVKSIRS